MRRLPLLLVVLLSALLLGAPARLAAQGPVHAVDLRPLSRRVSALRLRAMLQTATPGPTPASHAALSSADAIPSLAVPAVRLTGRTVWIPLCGPLDLRAGLSWWSTGLRSSLGFSLRF